MLTVVVTVAVLALGCSSSTSESTSDTAVAPDTTAGADAPDTCPVDPVSVVVSVNQWGDVVESLAGACGEVTTIIGGSADDPHDYEPTPADNAAFGDADLVVVNGLDYDHWALDAVEALPEAPPVVDAGEVVGLEEGANPHLWYGPDYVDAVAGAVTSALSTAAPEAAGYFDEQAEAWQASMQPYRDEIAAIRADHTGTTYAATESVFEYMATALGLVDVTPAGYATAAANESEPSPGDLFEFESTLSDGSAAVLVYNTQTEGSLTEQLRDRADQSSVPVVEVTETVPPGVTSFVEWQVGQLRALAAALSQ